MKASKLIAPMPTSPACPMPPATTAKVQQHITAQLILALVLTHCAATNNSAWPVVTHLHWQLPKGIAKTMGIQLISVYFLNQLEGDYINAGGSDWVSDAPLLWTALQTLQWTKAISGNTVYASVMPLTQRLSGNLGSSATNAISPDAINAIQPQISAYVLRSLGDQFPPVPDLWHISRSGGTQVGSSTALADDSWIIESSAISDTLPANSALSDDATFSPNIPFAKDPNAAGIPFRYIGTSTTPATDWTPGSFTDTTKYLQELTAVGYNPQANASGYINYEFANLYPNCMGVFSLCDTAVSKASQSQTNPVVYQLIGSYSQPENDYLYLFVQDYINRNLNSSNQIQIKPGTNASHYTRQRCQLLRQPFC